jgi:hypothetical protein
MGLNLANIHARFNAGISTVAIDSPTGAEQSVVAQITNEFLNVLSPARRMRVLLWDTARQLQVLSGGNDYGSTPDGSAGTSGAPVDLLKYILSLCSGDSSTSKSLFIVKDVYPYISGASASPTVIRWLKEVCYALKRSQHRLILLHDGEQTPIVFQDLIADLKHPLPDESEATAIVQRRITALQDSARSQRQSLPVNLDDDGMKRLVRAVLGMTQEAIDDVLQLVAIADRKIDDHSIEAINRIKQQRYASQGIEYAQAPDVEVQGMPVLSEWATRMGCLLEPTAQDWNIPFPKGMLLAGEGGTGKTLGVKCLAKTWGLPIVVLDLSKLMQKELGASEANLRAVIQAAEAIAPSILMLDEIDKMLGGSDNDGGTSSRILGYFLQWFQEHNSSVFVAATANEPWKLKPELIRRFAKCFLVDLPDIPARRGIFQVQMERYRLLETIGPDMAKDWLDVLSEQTPDFTGDEIRKVVHESAVAAYAAGQPGQTTLDAMLVEINLKEPQFRRNNQRLLALREWASSGNASFVREASQRITHEQSIGDSLRDSKAERLVNFAD